MKLRQLRYVQAVAETSSFSQAAELCHATQPTLSNSIAQLEEELGGKLFLRTTRSVELTPFGAHLLPYVTAALDAGREIAKAAEAWHNPQHKLLRIGFSPLVDARLVDSVLEPYRLRQKDVSIFFKECLLDDLGQRLAGQTIDVAIVPKPVEPSSLASCGFYDDALYYLPRDEPGAPDRDAVGIGELPDAPVILTGGGCGLNGMLQALFDREGAKFTPYPGQAVSYQAIEDWSELGIGAGILPYAKITRGRDHAVPLLLRDGSEARVAYDWIWNAEQKPQAHILDFIDYIRLKLPALVASGVGRSSPPSQPLHG